MAWSRPKSGTRDTDAPVKAIILMLTGGAVLTLNDGLIKVLAADYPTGQVLAIRGLFIYFPILFFAYRAGGLQTLWQIKSWRGQSLRGFCVVGSSFCFVTGLSYLPLADAIAIAFAGPLFVTALAPLLLGETVGWRRWSAVSVGFIGVLLIVQPGTAGFQWFAIFPLMAAFLGGIRDIITRTLAPSESSVAVLFVTTTTVLCAGSLSYFVTDWKPVQDGHWIYFVGSGLLIGVAHYLMIEAFRYGEAALVSPFKYGNLLWATLFGFLLFGDLPDTMMLAGAGVLVASGLYILRRERKVRSRA